MPTRLAPNFAWPFGGITVSGFATMSKATAPTKTMPTDGPAAIEALKPAASEASRALELAALHISVLSARTFPLAREVDEATRLFIGLFKNKSFS